MQKFDNETIEKAKYWFGDGEIDIDKMIETGVITLEKIMKMYEKEVLS